MEAEAETDLDRGIEDSDKQSQDPLLRDHCSLHCFHQVQDCWHRNNQNLVGSFENPKTNEFDKNAFAFKIIYKVLLLLLR